LNNFWLVVSTHLKNISQNGNLPQVGVKIKNMWNHHLDLFMMAGIPKLLSLFELAMVTFQLMKNTSGECNEPSILETTTGVS